MFEWQDGDVRVSPVGRIEDRVHLPGSKSLTNRYLTCLTLADGPSTLVDASIADDANCMLAGLEALGVQIRCVAETSDISIEGTNGGFVASEAALQVGNAGTAMRFLAAMCCLAHGKFQLDGSARMRERPIAEMVDALRALGAQIEYDLTDGYPPITVHPATLRGGELNLTNLRSSQFVSAILMVAPYAADDVFVQVDDTLPSRPYVDMTVRVMRSAGVEVLQEGDRFIVPAAQRYRAGSYRIEPDASAATYFWAAAALTGGRIRINGLSRSSLQGDVGFVDVLARMGCQVSSGEDYLEVAGPDDAVLHGVNEDLNAMPDTVQTLAILALFARGKTEIRNVANLRVKETDRLAALSAELARLGATVDVHRDGLTIFPPDEITPAAIETYNDHRMAMSFAIAGLALPEGLVIRDAGCVSKSFPGFFDTLGTL